MTTVVQKIKRYYAVYAAALVAVVCVGVYVWVFIRTNQYHAEILLTQEELLVQVERERHVRDTAGVLSSLKEERALVNTFFKTPNDIISIIEDIEGLRRVIGTPVSVLQVQVEGEDPLTREGTFVASILSEGSWKQMTQLLGLLDSLPFHARVTQATLETVERVDGAKGAPLWVVRAALSIALKK